MNGTLDASLIALTGALIDQEAAEVVVEPQSREPGFWFGGGNMAVDAAGHMIITGRYRNSGDSTTGLAKGARGLELAIFRSAEPFVLGESNRFEKIVSFSKEELSGEAETVLSIEGTAIALDETGVTLYLSTEKAELPYPDGLEEFKKPGTGVWTIDRISSQNVAGLKAGRLESFVAGDEPHRWHVKDPVIHRSNDGKTHLFFCTHPFSWTSSNSGHLEIREGRPSTPNWSFFPRGATWDVAVSRVTDVLELSSDRVPSDQRIALLFYDGAECMRRHKENPQAVRRPRGYSCEEIAGLARYADGDPSTTERISTNRPLFLSPYGTGSCRYIHTVQTEAGIVATWQQAQEDGSQPLVMHGIPWKEVARILGE